MRYPTVAEALTVASAILDAPVEVLSTAHTLHLLDSALNAPQATWAGEDLVQGLERKMAVLCVHLARNHPLPDGNKRLAWVLMNMFVELNGHTIERDLARSICLIWAVAAGEADEDEVERIVGQWIRPKELVSA